MQRTIKLALNPTTKQVTILLDTLHEHADCFNVVTAYGFTNEQRNGVELHKATYYPLRAAHPRLPAQLVCSARVRATEAVKSALTRKRQGRKVSCPHSELPPIRYDARSYRVLPDRNTVSLSTVEGRMVLPISVPTYAERTLSLATGFDSADLIYRKGRFWLHLVVTLPAPDPVDNGQAEAEARPRQGGVRLRRIRRVVGIDLGIKRPAVLSTNLFLGSRYWREVEARYFRLKRKLQAKGTKSAKRHLRRLSGKVNRFRLDCDHVLSRRIVDSVEPGTTLVFENLDDIRSRVRQRHGAQNRRLHSWSYRQLRAFTTYKAEEKAVRVIAVDPRNTSKGCSVCGYVHRLNRLSQSEFRCRACGFQLNADLNASRNLAERGKSALGGPSSSGLSCQSA